MNLKAFVTRMFQDSLFRNSIYLMLGTAIMGVLGFVFWFITARLFSTEEIGLATALLSSMNLIAILSLLGFDSALMRFLPQSKDRTKSINTGLVLVGIGALIFSTIFVLMITHISPRMSFADDHISYAIIFIATTVITALNILTESIFISARKSNYTLVINSIFSLIKMVLPFAFIGWGAMGIFIAAAVAQGIGLLINFFVMIWKFEYRPRFSIDMPVLKEVWVYSTANYFAGILSLLPATVLPIIIINHLGPESSAYFYIAMMVGNLLYVIPSATARSLFAESSNDVAEHSEHVRKSVRTLMYLLVPAILILLAGSELFLSVFGKEYAEGGATFLRIIAITGISVSIDAIFISIFRITHNLQALIVANLFYTVSIISLTYAFLPMGLVGVGIAWFVGNTLTSVVSYGMYRFDMKNKAVPAEI